MVNILITGLIILIFLSLSGKGFLTIDDLKKAFTQVAPHMGHHRLESIFRCVQELFPPHPTPLHWGKLTRVLVH